MARKRKAWSKTIEEAGVAIRLYEREPGSVLSREVRLPDGGKDRKSLGHRDRVLAEQQARALGRRLSELRHAGHSGPVTLGQLAALYDQQRLPLLSDARQRTVRGQLALLLEHFGRAFLVDDLSQHHADAYAAARRSGAIRSVRHRTPEPGVRDGTVRNELHLLTAMLRWARGHKVSGRRLLSGNPMEGVTVPQETNTRRPVATEERYRATLAIADQVDPRGRFRCLLVLARHTGRRVNAICQLRAADVLRTRDQVERALAATGQPIAAAAHWTHGAIRWRAAHDKRGYETVAPLGPEARSALDAYLCAQPRVGDVPLFPASGDDAAPVHKVMAGYWLQRAEVKAELPKLERGAWHAFRRLWASERRHLPAQDVMAAGGWRDVRVMQRAYQHADAATMFSVVASPHGPPPRVQRRRLEGQGTPIPSRRDTLWTHRRAKRRTSNVLRHRQTLNLNSMTSPSCTTYSFPSLRTAPFSRAPFQPPRLTKSS